MTFLGVDIGRAGPFDLAPQKSVGQIQQAIETADLHQDAELSLMAARFSVVGRFPKMPTADLKT